MSDTSIVLKNEYGEYSIKISVTDATINQMFKTLFIPALLAAGYGKEDIDNYIENEI